jgi:TonB family protein
VMIPTNLDVKDTAKEKFGEFYVSLFDHTLEQNPKAVVTEYAWAATGCDPCPGPDAALTQQELLELGGDVLPSWSSSLSTMKVGGRSVPQVMQSQATVGAGLDKDIVRRIVRAHINEVRSCYNAGLTKNLLLTGKVVVDFTINAKGKVETPKVASSTLGDTTVDACIAKAVGRWTFPKPTGGGSVAVSYPFSLAPGSGGTVGGSGSSGAFVLTRLHARYDATSLGEDLVFEAAPAITGGREAWGIDGKLEQGATVVEGGTNNFQARYAIRNEWPGEIACAEPVRGRWGGPPEGGSKQPTVARQLADVARGGSLASFITASGLEQIGTGVAAVRELPSVEDVAKATLEQAPAPPPAEVENAAGGCACSADAAPDAPLAPLALLALLGLRRKRAAKPAS